MKKLSAIFLAVLLGLSTMTTVFAEGEFKEIPEDKLLTEEILESGKNAITEQSSDLEVKAGETAVFTVSAEGMVRSYQWQVSKDGGKTWKKLSAKADTLSIEAKAEYDGWLYRCAVTFKGLKVVYSEPVTLTVKSGAMMTEGVFRDETDEYLITVSFTEEAGIPEGTEMFVRRIDDDSAEYRNYWNQSLAKLNENAVLPEDSADEVGTRKGIAAAVFFDITLMNGDEEVQPKVPAQINITLKNGGLPLFAGETAKVVHFGDSGMRKAGATELIEDVEVNEAGALADGMPEGVALDSFTYDQTGFSVVGVFTTDLYIDFEAAEYVVNLGELNNLAVILGASAVKAAGDPTINAGKTVTDNDGDGIYELALSVNATSQQSSVTEATKSNIVMVIDVSGSMGNEQSWIYYDTYTYDASTYNEYRYYSSSTSTNQRLYYRNGAWRTSNDTYGTVYNGTVYAYETRLHATKRAACAVVDALLAYNTNEYNITDMFEITVIKFARLTASGSYNGTETIIRDSTNGTAIKTAINNLTHGGGTNWEAALNLAKTEADYYKNSDPSTQADNPENTSVIFLTDGFPTFYVNNNGSQGGDGDENNNNIATSYTQARPSARTIVQAGYTLYNIFAFGSDTTTHNNHTGFDYLRALTNYAYGSGNNDNFGETDVTRQYAFNAKSTDDLIAAFDTIINHITNNVGYAGVNLTDGVSLGATSTSVAVNGTAKTETMRYTVKDTSGKISYTVKIDANGVATFKIYNADGTQTPLTDNAPETVTTTINGTTIESQVYSVTVGTGDNAKTYKMSPASINADTGMVTWDLAGLGILESGYTYTVAFDVWPNQLAYDIVADLNNGIYTSVDAALDAYGVTDATERKHIKDAIVHNDDGSYSLYTNYEQGVEYYPATSQTDDSGNVTWTYGSKQTQPIPQPDPVPLKGSLLPLAKAWESDLALSELNELLWEDGIVGGTSREYTITLHVWKADTREEALNQSSQPISESNQPYITAVLGWDAATNQYIWEKDAAVAPGTMVNIAEAEELGFDISDESKIRTFTNESGTVFTYYVIEPGHYYYVTEEGSDLHFELEAILYHPMVVDGVLCNVFFGPDQTVVNMDKMNAVTATNYLKGGLDVMKKVYGGDYLEEGAEPVDSTTEFAYEIKIWKEDENGAKHPVYTTDAELDDNGEMLGGALGWRIYDEDMIELEEGGRGPILATTGENANPRIVIGAQETTITVALPANQIFYLANVSTGTHYTVTEIQDEASVYKHFKTTLSETQDFESFTDKASVELEAEEIELSNHSISDVIHSNTSDVVTFHNGAPTYFYVYHSSNNEVEKISFLDERVKGTFDTETGKYIYTFDIVNETAAGFLYGGYYKVFSGAGVTDAQLNETSTDTEKPAVTYTEDAATGRFWYKDTAGTPYDASKANVWKGANAYTGTVETTGGGIGTAMTPRPGVVYYLKEVPNGYIRPYIHFTYDDRDPAKPLKKLYVITAADDVNYSLVGYILGDAATGTAATSRSLVVTIKKPDGTIDATLTAKSVFKAEQMAKYTDKDGSNPAVLSRGYLHVTDFSSSIGTAFTFQPCWNTLDGVLVKGLTVRTVNGGTNYLDGDAGCIGVTDVAAP